MPPIRSLNLGGSAGLAYPPATTTHTTSGSPTRSLSPPPAVRASAPARAAPPPLPQRKTVHAQCQARVKVARRMAWDTPPDVSTKLMRRASAVSAGSGASDLRTYAEPGLRSCCLPASPTPCNRSASVGAQLSGHALATPNITPMRASLGGVDVMQLDVAATPCAGLSETSLATEGARARPWAAMDFSSRMRFVEDCRAQGVPAHCTMQWLRTEVWAAEKPECVPADEGMAAQHVMRWAATAWAGPSSGVHTGDLHSDAGLHLGHMAVAPRICVAP